MEEFSHLDNIETTPFEPTYTNEFRKYLEESIMRSKLAEVAAIKSASQIFIF